jgi:hypothetical protein
MALSTILASYIFWHYGQAYKDLKTIFLNLIWFLFHFFSISVLLKTLFSPWKRVVDETYKGGLDIEGYASATLVNIIMRLVGFVSRSILILAGLICIIFILISAILVFIAWTLLPGLIVVIIGYSIFFITA